MSQSNIIEKCTENKQPELRETAKIVHISRMESVKNVDKCFSPGFLGMYYDSAVPKSKRIISRSGTPVLRNPECGNQPVFEVNRSCSSLDRDATASTSSAPFTTHVEDCELKTDCAYAVTISQREARDTSNVIQDEINALSQKESSCINIHSTDILPENTTLPEEDINANVEILSVNEVFPSTSEESVEKMERSCYKNILSDCNIPHIRTTMRVVGSNPGEPKMKYEEPVKKSSKSKMKNFFRKLDKRKTSSSEQKIVPKVAIRSILKVANDWFGDSPQETNGDYHSSNDGEGDKTLDFSIDTTPTSNTAKHERSADKSKAVSFNSDVSVLFVSYVGGDTRVTGRTVQRLSRESDQQARSAELRKSYSIFKMTRYPHIPLVQFSPHPGKCAQMYRNCHV